MFLPTSLAYLALSWLCLALSWPCLALSRLCLVLLGPFVWGASPLLAVALLGTSGRVALLVGESSAPLAGAFARLKVRLV